MKKMRSEIFHEIRKILLSFIGTLALLLIVAIWRIFNTSVFIFIQILFCSFILLIVLYLARNLSRNANVFYKNEILVVAISFIIVTFLLLNIDRSRSIFLLKWVESYGKTGVTSKIIAHDHNLSESDYLAIAQRIGEQEQSGMLVVRGEKIFMTKMGEVFVFVVKRIATLENLVGFDRA